MARYTCPHARYDPQMRLMCRKSGTYCAHQKWCALEGRSVMTEGAADCPGREKEEKKK